VAVILGLVRKQPLAVQHLPDFLFGFSKFYLQPSDEFILLSFDVSEVVISEGSVGLFQAAFDLVSSPFNLEFVHGDFSVFGVPGSGSRANLLIAHRVPKGAKSS
jgi:hypothetical protein